MKFLFLIALLVGQVAVAQEAANVSPEIIEIRKSLPMEPTEKAVRDFILNRGSAVGLKAGAYVNVVREVAVNDPVRNKSLGALHIPVGKLQIIHVENNISVARLQSELGNDERPMLEYEALMIGDEVDLNSISMEVPKASKKKWSTAATDSTTQTAEATTVAAVQAPAEQTVEPVAQKATELASTAPAAKAPVQQPAKSQASEEPAFIITPIDNESDAPVKDKTSFIPTESATVTASTTAN